MFGLGNKQKRMYEMQIDMLKLTSLYFALQTKGVPDLLSMVLAQDVFGKEFDSETMQGIHKSCRDLEKFADELSKKEIKWSIGGKVIE